MLLAIISDTHDNIPNIEKFLSWAKANKIERIIHCGDIASIETVDFLAKNFINEISVVFGNMDSNYKEVITESIANYPNISLFGNVGKINLVFYGHTHKPWMETLPNGCQLINPGTLGGVFQKATFAVYDTQTKKMELEILEIL